MFGHQYVGGRRGDRNGKHRIHLDRQMSHEQVRRRLDASAAEWHAAAETRFAQAVTERLANSLLRRPELKKRRQLVSLGAHPRQLSRIEPATRECSHVARRMVFDVHTDRPCLRRRNHHELAAVAAAHRETVDAGLAAGFVAQGRRADERAREVEQQVVGRGSRLITGRGNPDVHGFQTGSRTFLHRKKVSR